MMIEDYPKNQDWEYVIPVKEYMALSWVDVDDWNKMKADERLYKYVMHRLRRSWKHNATSELVKSYINSYYDEYWLEK